MPGIPKGEWIIHHHHSRDLAEPCDHRTRLVEQPHMGVASRQKTTGGREKRPVFNSYSQPRDSLFETPAERQKPTQLGDSPFATANGRLYLNFLSANDDRNVMRDGVGRETYKKLARIKAKYDSTNFFRLNQNIAPE